MLTSLDRIVVATRDRRPVVDALCSVFDAEVVDRDSLPLWSAERTTVRAGVSEIEVLEPDGVGALADFIGRRGPGLFAVGFASAALEDFRVHLETQGVSFERHERQIFLTSDKGVDLPGLNLIITPAEERERVGLLQRLCGATLLHRAVKLGDAGDTWTRLLGVHASQLSKVSHAIPGVTGTVVRLGEGVMSHFAILEPWGKSTPIARFYSRNGPGIYLATAISEKLDAIRERLGPDAHAAPGRPAEGLLLIPSRLLGGARLAVSDGAVGCSSWDVSSAMFRARQVWD